MVHSLSLAPLVQDLLVALEAAHLDYEHRLGRFSLHYDVL